MDRKTNNLVLTAIFRNQLSYLEHIWHTFACSLPFSFQQRFWSDGDGFPWWETTLYKLYPRSWLLDCLLALTLGAPNMASPGPGWGDTAVIGGPGSEPCYRSGMIGGRQAGGITFGCKHANINNSTIHTGGCKIWVCLCMFIWCGLYSPKVLDIKE